MREKRELGLRTPAVFTALQVMAAAALAIGTLLACYLGYIGYLGIQLSRMENSMTVFWMAVVGIVTVADVSVCCYVALIVFLRMCGRLKRGSAFTVENAGAMETIAKCLTVAGLTFWATTLILFLLQGPQTGWSLLQLDGRFLILGFCFLGVALLAYALCLLVRRAAELQRESDLTI